MGVLEAERKINKIKWPSRICRSAARLTMGRMCADLLYSDYTKYDI